MKMVAVMSGIRGRFTARVLERPTVIGRRRALVLRGNGRFARTANLTGTEALERLYSAQLRLGVRIQDMFRLPGLQPAYAFGSEGVRSGSLELPDTHFSSGGVPGTGKTEGGNAEISEQELDDFRLFITALKQMRKAERMSVLVPVSATILGALGGGLAGDIFPISSSWALVEGYVAGLLLFGSISCVLWAQDTIGPSIVGATDAVRSSESALVSRYKDEGIPPIFQKLNPKAAARLENAIAEANPEGVA